MNRGASEALRSALFYRVISPLGDREYAAISERERRRDEELAALEADLDHHEAALRSASGADRLRAQEALDACRARIRRALGLRMSQ